MADTKESSFLQLLIEDVEAAIKRRDDQDTQSTRRDLVRAIFAAIDGTVWSFRETVASAATDTYGLQPEEEIILSEVSHSVTKSGKISTQSRYVPQRAMIKLVTRIAYRISGEAVMDFSEAEWAKHESATAIRNRITHPKSAEDLSLSDQDIQLTLEAFYWLFEKLTDVMVSTVKARIEYLGEFREVLDELRQQRPETVRLYEAIQAGKEL